MPKNWSIPRTSYDALGKLNIQRSPAIDRAIWASKADPTKIIRAMESRLTQALATAAVRESAPAADSGAAMTGSGAVVAAVAPAADSGAAMTGSGAVVAAVAVGGAVAGATAAAVTATTSSDLSSKTSTADEKSATKEVHSAPPHTTKAVPGSKLVNGDEYVRVSVSYPKKTEEAVEYLAGLFKLSYEETVRLSLEAYIKHL